MKSNFKAPEVYNLLFKLKQDCEMNESNNLKESSDSIKWKQKPAVRRQKNTLGIQQLIKNQYST